MDHMGERCRELEHQLAERDAVLEQFRAERAILTEANARLSENLQVRDTKLTELLDQQAATSEILRIISSSPTDLQPVFETILANATRLCGAQLGFLGLFDGEKYEYVAMRGGSDVLRSKMLCGPFAPVTGTNLWRTLFERRSIHVEDMQTHQQVHSPVPIMLNEGARTLLSVPMLKDGESLGTIVIYRYEVRPFLPAQIELVSTFADQAVIAIENVRLFKELQTKNAELAESLE